MALILLLALCHNAPGWHALAIAIERTNISKARAAPGCRSLNEGMSMRASAAWLLTMGLSACAWQGPALEGHAGLQWRVVSFYGAHASERQWSCPNPAMQSVTSTRVVEDTPEKVVMDIRYYWVDWSQATDIPGGSITTCRDFGERTFTFTKNTDGTLQPESMTGPQKRA